MQTSNESAPLRLLRLVACHPAMALTQLLPIPRADLPREDGAARRRRPSAVFLNLQKRRKSSEQPDVT
jgi:hypothetical protein